MPRAAKLLLPKTALKGHVPCVPSPLAQACGGEDILYTFFEYFLDTLSHGPHHKSLLGALLLAAPCFNNTSPGDYEDTFSKAGDNETRKGLA